MAVSLEKQNVTLTNTGNAALTISSIAASGDFAETSAGATASPISPTTLAAGANCMISVTFTPTVVGARTGTLTVTDNAGGSPQTVSLTGNGTSPPPGFTPERKSVGEGKSEELGGRRIVKKKKNGKTAVTVSSISASVDMAETTAGASVCPISRPSPAAGANCMISVTFTPTVAGARTGTLTITDNAGGSPQTVSLTGNGTSPPPDFT